MRMALPALVVTVGVRAGTSMIMSVKCDILLVLKQKIIFSDTNMAI